MPRVTLLACLILAPVAGAVAAQEPDTLAWNRTRPYASIQEWEALVVVWFHKAVPAENRLVLVDTIRRLETVRRAPVAEGRVHAALPSERPACKAALYFPCVEPGEAILRFAPLRAQAAVDGKQRWATGVWVIQHQKGQPVAHFYSVRFEGSLDGPLWLISAVVASH
jgi:hypothetical protein